MRKNKRTSSRDQRDFDEHFPGDSEYYGDAVAYRETKRQAGEERYRSKKSRDKAKSKRTRFYEE